MFNTGVTLRVIVAFIGVAILLLAADLHRQGNNLASLAMIFIDIAIVLEAVLFDKGGYKSIDKEKK